MYFAVVRHQRLSVVISVFSWRMATLKVLAHFVCLCVRADNVQRFFGLFVNDQQLEEDKR